MLRRLHIDRYYPEIARGPRRGYPIERAAWIGPAQSDPEQPACLLFRLDFMLDETLDTVLWVSADQRYALFLDGRLVSRGPDRSDLAHWSFSALPVRLSRGRHVLLADVVFWGSFAPGGQLGLRPGFLLHSSGKLEGRLDTGTADWRCAVRRDIVFRPGLPDVYHVVGPAVTVDAKKFHQSPEWRRPAVIERYRDNDYGIFGAKHTLVPAEMPEQKQEFFCGGRIRALNSARDEQVFFEREEPGDLCRLYAEVPGETQLNVLWDLEDYFCAYPLVETEGGAGASVEMLWAESLFEAPGTGNAPKGNRDEIAGKWFYGFGDCFLPSGGKDRFTVPWWRAGRYILIRIRTGKHPCRITSVTLETTGYPFESLSRFELPGVALAKVVAAGKRSLQMCAHETLMDCPYYEQMMYVADSRLELLSLYADSRDSRLPERVIELFDWSRHRANFVLERYPAREEKLSLTFAAIWILMLRDFLYYRFHPEFLRLRLPGMRSMLEYLICFIGEDGLLRELPGWSFVDWVPDWPKGVPPRNASGSSCLENLHAIYALQAAAELESALGEPVMAQRWLRYAEQLQCAVRKCFWSERRALFSDDGGDAFSEHAQALAILTETFPEGRAFDFKTEGLTRCSLYFRFYLWEAYKKIEQGTRVLQGIHSLNELILNGFKTMPECLNATRSDCHAWSSHLLFHLIATVAGIRPDDFGFRKVRIAPVCDTLTCCAAHPAGKIRLELRSSHGVVELPSGVTGKLCLHHETIPLNSGRNTIEFHEKTDNLREEPLW